MSVDWKQRHAETWALKVWIKAHNFVTRYRSQVDAAQAKYDALAFDYANLDREMRRQFEINEANRKRLAERDAAVLDLARVEMQLQAAQDALEQVMAEHTAAVDLLRALYNYAGGPSYEQPDGAGLVPGMDRGTLGEVWAYLNNKEQGA